MDRKWLGWGRKRQIVDRNGPVDDPVDWSKTTPAVEVSMPTITDAQVKQVYEGPRVCSVEIRSLATGYLVNVKTVHGMREHAFLTQYDAIEYIKTLNM